MTARAHGLGGITMIVRRSLRQHALSTFVTVASAALASGLVMAVFAVSAQSRAAFEGGRIGYDAVLGARGSQLQLVLNAIYHLETSPGNIPWATYIELKEDERVERAVPYAVGDSWRGYRVVGTTEDLFADHAPQPGGRFFDPGRREAVLGAAVARETGLKVGASVHPDHGLLGDGALQHEEEYVVVGVLEPTNTPSDRVLWIPIEGVFRMGGHVLRGAGETFTAVPGEAIPDEHKEVSAVLLKFRGGQRTGMFFNQKFNLEGKEATLAWPIAKSMAELFDKLGWVNRILELVAYLVVAVAAGSILASIYNTMNERRREFAILRALGARRRTVFSAIVIESGTIAFLGCLVGFFVYGVIMTATAVIVKERTGVVIEVLAWHEALYWTPLGAVGLGAVAGLMPAFKAYATDVASNLLPVS
ncbi:MAG: ABC transporter permease [Planctomycetota bacterium]|nr:ABC transporter permease [Planctomycetota bacterium]